MTIQFEAVFQNGVILPKEALPLANGTHIRVAIEAPPQDPLADVIGIGEGPASGDSADRHDDYIYGPM
jgi:predicted DNA-binding antitoxin AbrB/MazE fold protein